MTDKKEPRKRILDGLKNASPEQWKKAWERATAQEAQRDAWLAERIAEGKKKKDEG